MHRKHCDKTHENSYDVYLDFTASNATRPFNLSGVLAGLFDFLHLSICLTCENLISYVTRLFAGGKVIFRDVGNIILTKGKKNGPNVLWRRCFQMSLVDSGRQVHLNSMNNRFLDAWLCLICLLKIYFSSDYFEIIYFLVFYIKSFVCYAAVASLI